METTYDGTSDQARGAGQRLKNDIKDGAHEIKSVASSEIKSLIADVEDLVARIAELKDADVIRVRNKVERAIATAKQGLSEGADTLKRQAREYAGTAEDYVRESPWQALGIAALVGVVVGVLATRRS
jgi:ElaB/YqjD/DUF883 family membrane-anchored ribosome-binding protein